MPRMSSPHVGWGLLAAAVALGVYWPLVGVHLTGDDYLYWHVAHFGLGPSGAWRLLPGARARPVGSWLFVGLLHFNSMHLLAASRLLHHSCNALLVAAIARRRLRFSAPAAAVAGVAFLVWGCHGEVFYYSSIHDLCAASGILLAMWMAAAPLSPGRQVGLFLFAWGAYASKEAAWPLPLLLLWLLPCQPAGRAWRWRACALASLALLGVLVLRQFWIGTLRGENEPSIYATIEMQRLVRTVPKLLVRSVIPGTVNLQASGMWLREHLWIAAAGLSLAVAALGGCLWGRRHDRLALALFACYGVCLGPVAQLSISLENSENARYLYIPCIFVVLLLGHAVQVAQQRRWVGVMVGGVLLVQAHAVHCIGTNARQATRLTDAYRAALERLQAAHPHVRHFYVACVPDNFRGAFAARNVSEQIAPPGHVTTVLSTRYITQHNYPACRFDRQSDGLILRAPGGPPQLTHPTFLQVEPDPASLAGIEPFVLEPENLSPQGRTCAVRLTIRQPLPVDALLAVYDGIDLRPVAL